MKCPPTEHEEQQHHGMLPKRRLRLQRRYVQTRYHQKTGLVCLVLFRHHTLFGQFLFRILVFGKAREAHAAQHIASLGELNIIIADDFDTVAPGIAKI